MYVLFVFRALTLYDRPPLRFRAMDLATQHKVSQKHKTHQSWGCTFLSTDSYRLNAYQQLYEAELHVPSVFFPSLTYLSKVRQYGVKLLVLGNNTTWCRDPSSPDRKSNALSTTTPYVPLDTANSKFGRNLKNPLLLSYQL